MYTQFIEMKPNSFTMPNLVRMCLPGTERNPYTKRCNKKCKSNKQVRIKNDPRKTFRCYQKCKQNQQRDSKTNRCRRTVQRMRRLKTKSASKSKSPLILIDRVYHRSRSRSKNNSKARTNSKTFSYGKLYDLKSDLWDVNPNK